MKTKYLTALLSILIAGYNLHAQFDSVFHSSYSVDEWENILESAPDDENISADDILEDMETWQAGRPNLNKLTYETAIRELELTDYQYYQLQLYLENYGELASIFELDGIDGFGKLERERLQKTTIVAHAQDDSVIWKDFFRKGKNKLLIRYGQILEQQAGYDTTQQTHYSGTPGHALFRYTFDTQERFSLKISGEKDPGEQFFRGEQRYGFDFYAGSVSIKKLGILKYAVLGDYRLNFGQGLVLGSSLLSGKGSGVGAVRRFSTGIRAIAPTSEGDFLRGTAFTLGNEKLEGTLFAGRSAGKTTNALGTNFSYRRALFRIGLRTAIHSNTDTCGTSFTEKLSSSFHPTGFNIAADYQAILFKQLLFGEIGVNQKGALGCLQAAVFNLIPIFKIAAIFRYYAPNYTNPMGHSFGTNSKNAGETGFYLTGNYILSRAITMDLYADYYRLTTSTYRTDAPVQGLDIGTTLQIDLGRHSKLQIRYTFREKPENSNNSRHYKVLQEHHKHKIRLIWTNTPLSWLQLKTESDWTLNRYPMTKTLRTGLLLYQDIAITIPQPNIALHARVAYFDTDSYDERLYAYENDVYYAFSIGSYYYKGVRGYLLIRYKYKWISLWLRLAQTYYIDRQIISSGLTQINKPHKTEVKIQVMCSW